MRTQIRITLAVAIAILFTGTAAIAKPEYAMKEKQDCLYCHERPGEARNFRGLYYAANEYSFGKFEEEFEAKIAGVKAGSKGFDARPINKKYPIRDIKPVYDFVLTDINEKPVNLGRYMDEVLLIVNIATMDPTLSRQIVSLQRLQEKHKGRGFTILAFPCNDFDSGEPGSNKRIKDTCRTQYDLTFRIFAKVTTLGNRPNPFYRFLMSKKTNTQFGGDIDGNFTKILISRNGEILGRWKGNVDPMSDRITREVDAAVSYPRAALTMPGKPQ